MKDILYILKRNILSPIVIAILILAGILLYLNEKNDAWFLSFVILVNTSIAVVQEIRANRALKKLELMSAPTAHKIESDGIKEVPFDALVAGDVIELRLGDEVPADCKIIKSGGIELDESILTGESIPVDKNIDDMVYAASQVVSGGAKAQVVAVGAESRVGAMTATLKRYKPQLTPMQKDINTAIYWLTYGAVGLAIIIVIAYSLSGESTVKILKTITSAAVTIVPEGLLLASSLLLAFGSLKLAKANVLPQKISAIEGMAQLNVLCVDKTGTLTSDSISFEKIEAFDKRYKNIDQLVAIVAKETGNGSPTSVAIISGTVLSTEYEKLDVLQFSSDRKMSGVKIKIDGKTLTVLMGAPEYLSKIAVISKEEQRNIEHMTSVGKRVLMVAVFDNPNLNIKKLDYEVGRAVGMIVLANELREGVKDTVKFLQNNGVVIKVISGDNPNTVGYIAREAGIDRPQNIITGVELQALDEDEWTETVKKTTIFARVLPEQKERLINTYESLGNYTGMVGDGVNDALALKRSDLGIAMYAGASASRRVADVVLLDNSFNSLPLGMKLGNKIMQSIEIVASLFFHKIIYGVVLLLTTIMLGVVYPYEPRHITFMNIFLVTMPTVMWTLFPPSPRHRLSPKYFWKNTLWAVAPIAFLSGLTVAVSYIFMKYLDGTHHLAIATSTVLIATYFGIYLVFLSPKMFEIKITRRTKTARLLYVLAVFVIVGLSFGVGILRDFFAFQMPSIAGFWAILPLIGLVSFLQWRLALYAGIKSRNQLSKPKR